MPNPFQRDLTESLTSQDHTRGNTNASVRIIIYMDVTDPRSIPIHNTVAEIIQTLSNEVAVAYRYFPQTIQFPQAFAVAQTLESAAAQDKFWDMVNHLLAHQDQLTDGLLRQHAGHIGLDKARFEDDFSSPSTLKRIQHDAQTAKDSHVETAPAIFINGNRQQTLSMRFVQDLIASDGNISG
ncbi:MAG: thioredoxin domain-containing protein [Phototrophicaceae bacterium]